jgi:hypothetical protein
MTGRQRSRVVRDEYFVCQRIKYFYWNENVDVRNASTCSSLGVSCQVKIFDNTQMEQTINAI